MGRVSAWRHYCPVPFYCFLSEFTRGNAHSQYRARNQHMNHCMPSKAVWRKHVPFGIPSTSRQPGGVVSRSPQLLSEILNKFRTVRAIPANKISIDAGRNGNLGHFFHPSVKFLYSFAFSWSNRPATCIRWCRRVVIHVRISECNEIAPT